MVSPTILRFCFYYHTSFLKVINPALRQCFLFFVVRHEITILFCPLARPALELRCNSIYNQSSLQMFQKLEVTADHNVYKNGNPLSKSKIFVIDRFWSEIKCRDLWRHLIEMLSCYDFAFFKTCLYAKLHTKLFKI